MEHVASQLLHIVAISLLLLSVYSNSECYKTYTMLRIEIGQQHSTLTIYQRKSTSHCHYLQNNTNSVVASPCKRASSEIMTLPTENLHIKTFHIRFAYVNSSLCSTLHISIAATPLPLKLVTPVICPTICTIHYIAGIAK